MIDDNGFLGECERCERYRVVRFDERLEIYLCKDCTTAIDEDEDAI